MNRLLKAALMSGGDKLDADAKLFFQALESDASPVVLAPLQKLAINNLIKSLKSNNLWSKFLIIYPFIGGVRSSHKYNLKDPRNLDVAYRMSIASGSVTDSNLGTDPIAPVSVTTKYSYDAGLKYDHHLSYYSDEINSTGKYSAGNYTSASSVMGLFTPSTSKRVIFQDLQSSDIIDLNINDDKGYSICSRINSSTFFLTVNGTVVGRKTNSNGAGSLPSGELLLFGPFAGEFGSNRCSFFTWGYGLTETQTIALNQIVQIYQSSLGRSVFF